jgi:hypothetical protein
MGSIFSFAKHTAAKPASIVGWETRYDGVLSVAIVDSIPVAGISGPWPDGNYALTWWSTGEADASPSLEFHSSMDVARARVEAMAGLPRQVAA